MYSGHACLPAVTLLEHRTEAPAEQAVGVSLPALGHCTPGVILSLMFLQMPSWRLSPGPCPVSMLHTAHAAVCLQVPSSTLGTDLSSLLETGENADVTFTVPAPGLPACCCPGNIAAFSVPEHLHTSLNRFLPHNAAG